MKVTICLQAIELIATCSKHSLLLLSIQVVLCKFCKFSVSSINISFLYWYFFGKVGLKVLVFFFLTYL